MRIDLVVRKLCLCSFLVVPLLIAGCGDDDDDDDINEPDPDDVSRGAYVVEHVAACGDCHTPRTQSGELDMSRWLAGVEVFADLDTLDPEVGAIGAPNLTPAALADWTDDEIKNAFLNGVDEDGDALFPIMPYPVFHNMTDADADQIVAYLRSIPAVENEIPERQPLPFPFNDPAQPVPESAIPHTTLDSTDVNFAAAERGRYLAGRIGACMECHTPPAQGPIPLDLTKLFAGGRGFELGLPSPPFPPVIFSRNITPHANGIQGWTAEDVQVLLLDGVDPAGNGVCPPMPSGPDGAFGGLTEQDALDIGYYVTTLPPIDNGVIEDCDPPGGRP
jgi:mono/diheme cytochrome c family protein